MRENRSAALSAAGRDFMTTASHAEQLPVVDLPQTPESPVQDLGAIEFADPNAQAAVEQLVANAQATKRRSFSGGNFLLAATVAGMVTELGALGAYATDNDTLAAALISAAAVAYSPAFLRSGGRWAYDRTFKSPFGQPMSFAGHTFQPLLVTRKKPAVAVAREKHSEDDARVSKNSLVLMVGQGQANVSTGQTELALRVAAKAAEQLTENGTRTKVLVPREYLHRAGGRNSKGDSLQGYVTSLTAGSRCKSSPDDESYALLTHKTARLAAERINKQNGGLYGAAVAALRRRFPSDDALAAASTPAAVKKAVWSLVEGVLGTAQTVALPHSKVEKVQEAAQGPEGGGKRPKHPRAVELPWLAQRDGRIIGGSALRNGLTQAIVSAELGGVVPDISQYTPKELAQLLANPNMSGELLLGLASQVVAAESSNARQPALVKASNTPQLATEPPRKGEKLVYTPAFFGSGAMTKLGRVLLGGVLVVGGSAAALPVIDKIESILKSSGNASTAELGITNGMLGSSLPWKVTAHGGADPRGFYVDRVYGQFDAYDMSWLPSSGDQQISYSVTPLGGPTYEHRYLQVESPYVRLKAGAQNDTFLPIMVTTEPENLRAVDAQGKRVPLTADVYENGSIGVHLPDGAKAQNARLEYNLVTYQTHYAPHPVGALEGDVPSYKDLSPAAKALANLTPGQIQAWLSENGQYDAVESDLDRLARPQPNATDALNTLVQQNQGDCAVYSTEAALLIAAGHPDEPVGVAGGFRDDNEFTLRDGSVVSFLAVPKHAEVITQDEQHGTTEVLDPTAVHLAPGAYIAEDIKKNQTLPSLETLEKQWETLPSKPLSPAEKAGLALLAGATLEARRRRAFGNGRRLARIVLNHPLRKEQAWQNVRQAVFAKSPQTAKTEKSVGSSKTTLAAPANKKMSGADTSPSIPVTAFTKEFVTKHSDLKAARRKIATNPLLASREKRAATKLTRRIEAQRDFSAYRQRVAARRAAKPVRRMVASTAIAGIIAAAPLSARPLTAASDNS